MMNKEQEKFWNTLRKPFPKRKHCMNCVNFIMPENRFDDIACNFYKIGLCCNIVDNSEFISEHPEALKKWEWDCVHSN